MRAEPTRQFGEQRDEGLAVAVFPVKGMPFVAASGEMIPSAGPLNPQGSGHAVNG